MTQTRTAVRSPYATASWVLIVAALFVPLVLVLLFALELRAEATARDQLQNFVNQVSLGDDRGSVERLLDAADDISQDDGVFLMDDEIPEGPGLDRLTVSTERRMDAQCHGDFVLEADRVIYIGRVWCT